ncbi:glycosyl transferase [Lactococcus termiticola]|uniref:Glycosyl transferase n=2 Tax=Lactococcus termiticola TaxID=2169526 RepID=A0A2R5HFD7_9LACT|nr:glycosyl transferase [Lactococcus termiticola]
MSQTQLISIIVPVYNAEAFLNETVQSILDQTYQNFELVLIDDNSSDRSPELIQAWQEKDSRVRSQRIEGGSAGLARNAGLDIARGDYILFVDADDLIRTDTLAGLYEPIKDKQSCFSMSKYTTERDLFEKRNSFGPNLEEAGELLAKLKLIQASGYPSFSPWGKLYSRDIFDEIRFPNFQIHEDTAVILPILDKAKKVVLVDKLDWYYRVNAGSLTQSKISEKNFAVFNKNQMQIAFAKEREPELLTYVYRLCLNENDFVSMNCLKDKSGISAKLFDELYQQNKLFSNKISGIRAAVYSSKIIYKTYSKLVGLIYSSDLLRGLAKKILT